MPDQFHLAQSIIDAHWRCSVLLRAHYLTWALVLNGFCVWVNQAVFARLCTCCLCVSNDFSSEFSSALACTVTGLGSFTADRKSTRLNSSHVDMSYAVLCLKNRNKS